MWYASNAPSTTRVTVHTASAAVVALSVQEFSGVAAKSPLDVAAGKKIFKQGGGLDSLYGSTKNADDFNVANAVYKEAQKVDSYIDPSLTMAVK